MNVVGARFGDVVVMVMVVVLVWEMRHAQWWVYRFGSFDRSLSRCENRFTSAEAIPFDFFILTNRLHGFAVQGADFFCFSGCAAFAEGADDGCAAPDRVGTGLAFGFFLLSDCANLIEVALENRSVGHVFGGLG